MAQRAEAATVGAVCTQGSGHTTTPELTSGPRHSSRSTMFPLDVDFLFGHLRQTRREFTHRMGEPRREVFANDIGGSDDRILDDPRASVIQTAIARLRGVVAQQTAGRSPMT
jgi:hypothetical protein